MTDPRPRSFCLSAPAIVTGFAAAELPRLLRRHAREALEDYPPEVRELLEDALRAMEEAGRQWRSAASSGNAEAALPEAPVSSEHERDGLDTREVAGVLRVSQRRVRQLVASGALPAHKRQGRWTFERGAVTEINNDRGAR